MNIKKKKTKFTQLNEAIILYDLIFTVTHFPLFGWLSDMRWTRFGAHYLYSINERFFALNLYIWCHVRLFSTSKAFKIRLAFQSVQFSDKTTHWSWLQCVTHELDRNIQLEQWAKVKFTHNFCFLFYSFCVCRHAAQRNLFVYAYTPPHCTRVVNAQDRQSFSFMKKFHFTQHIATYRCYIHYNVDLLSEIRTEFLIHSNESFCIKMRKKFEQKIIIEDNCGEFI